MAFSMFCISRLQIGIIQPHEPRAIYTIDDLLFVGLTGVPIKHSSIVAFGVEYEFSQVGVEIEVCSSMYLWSDLKENILVPLNQPGEKGPRWYRVSLRNAL